MKVGTPVEITIRGGEPDLYAVKRRPVEEVDWISGDKVDYMVNPPKRLFVEGDKGFKVPANGKPIRRTIIPTVVEPCRTYCTIGRVKGRRRPGASGNPPEIWIES